MRSYTGEPDAILSQAMAIEMLTPQIDNCGLGLFLYEEGSELFYFMHDGANDGYKSVLVAYPHRRQGVVIMTNGDNGADLWREILNSVSIEYGWVRNNTWLYGLGIVAISVVILVILTLRKKRREISSK